MLSYLMENIELIFYSKYCNLFTSSLVGMFDTFGYGIIFLWLTIKRKHKKVSIDKFAQISLYVQINILFLSFFIVGLLYLSNQYGNFIRPIYDDKEFAFSYFYQPETIFFIIRFLRCMLLITIVISLSVFFKVPWQLLGWKNSKQSLIKTLFIVMLIIFLYFFVRKLFINLTVLQSGMVVPLHNNVYWLIFDTVVITTLVPFAEEAYYRGVLMPSFASVSSWRIALILQAMIFMLAHDPRTFYLYPSYFIFGLIAGFWFYKTKSIYPCILFHSLFNCLIILANALTKQVLY